MAASHAQGVEQPDGRIIKEATCDVRHVADAVVHIASLPNTVNVLEMTIMWVLKWVSLLSTDAKAIGRMVCHTWGGVKAPCIMVQMHRKYICL